MKILVASILISLLFFTALFEFYSIANFLPIIHFFPSSLNVIQSPSIFFIHIGDDSEFFPDYIYIAVRQAAVWNPLATIHVVIPRMHEYRSSILDLVRDCGCLLQLWFIEDIPLTDIHVRFERETRLETGGFRSGFWRFTTERLFVLLDAMVMLGVNESIHLENDNLLYVQIDSILPTLRREYPGLAVEPHGANLCTAGFIVCATNFCPRNINDVHDRLSERHAKSCKISSSRR
jgi:hypothetical protein